MEMSTFVREQILRFLYQLIVGNAGLERRGTRGWAGAQEIQHAINVSSIAEALHRLRADGHVIRDETRLTATTSPSFVYRITTRGAHHIAERLDLPVAAVPEPAAAEDPAVYLRSGVRVALDALRHADTHPVDNPRIQDEPAWRSSRQLTDWLRLEGERTGRERRFFPDELAAAVSLGLAERREDHRGPLYRITALGRDVVTMEWHDLPPGVGAGA